MPPRNPRLDQLLAAVASGDEAAFAELYQATSSKLLGVALRILRSREVAEEVLQEAYFKVWERAGDFNPDIAAPMTWMAAIDPEPVRSWRQLTWMAALLLVAVVSTALLFRWLSVQEDWPMRPAHPDSVVDGEVTVADGEVTVVGGEVTVVDSDGNRVLPEPEPGSESER